MTYLINTPLPLKSYTVDNWEEILEHGSFRGYNIQRFQRKLEKDPDSIGFDKKTSTLTYSKDGEIKFTVPLYKIRKCKSRWSFSRFIYWIKTELFCSEKTDVSKLAAFIHEKTQISGRDRSAEKAKWKEHKLANNFSTLAEMKEVLPPETYNLVNQIHYEDWAESLRPMHKVLLGRVHQAMEFYKDDYYTFIHGQSLSYWVINQLIKELEKLKNPDLDVSLYHFLRLPGQEFKTTRQEHIENSLGDSLYDDLLGDDLLSVDAFLFHINIYESANYFVAQNTNIQLTNQKKIIKKVLNEYSLDEEDLVEEITKICANFKTLAAIGQIYTICIPKHRVEDLVYTAHSFGVACKCRGSKAQAERINNLQNHMYDTCPSGWFAEDHLPQYRILTHFLNPEETPIALHTPVSKEKKDEYKLKIRELVKAAYEKKTGP